MIENLERCPDCGALTPKVDGSTHRYLGASPGCWAVYGEVLDREYQEYTRYAPVHRLGVDAYAAQHPGAPSRQAIASVGVHLVRLHLVLECGLQPEKANSAMKWASGRKHDFVWLDPPASLGELTVLYVRDAQSSEEHTARMREWAQSVWEAWGAHHDTVRRWAAE